MVNSGKHVAQTFILYVLYISVVVYQSSSVSTSEVH